MDELQSTAGAAQLTRTVLQCNKLLEAPASVCHRHRSIVGWIGPRERPEIEPMGAKFGTVANSVFRGNQISLVETFEVLACSRQRAVTRILLVYLRRSNYGFRSPQSPAAPRGRSQKLHQVAIPPRRLGLCRRLASTSVNHAGIVTVHGLALSACRGDASHTYNLIGALTIVAFSPTFPPTHLLIAERCRHGFLR